MEIYWLANCTLVTCSLLVICTLTFIVVTFILKETVEFWVTSFL